MNMQAMMKQAQKLQKEMLEEQKSIQSKEYTSTSSIVTVVVSGDKKIKSIKINQDTIEKDDVEMLEDMIVVATNNCLNQIDEEIESKMGKYTKGLPGLF